MLSPGSLAAALSAPVQVAVLLGGSWLAISFLIQACARRAARLAARPAPGCFQALPPALTAATHLAFLGDLQRGVSDVPRRLAEVLPADAVDLLVSSGDFVSHGEGPYYGILLAAFERAGVVTPVRAVPGNHDLCPRRSKDDRLGGAEFTRAFGARHWALRAGPVLVVGLDNGTDWLVDAQLAWLERTLTAHPAMPWICVCHRPPFDFSAPDRPPGSDMRGLVGIFEQRPPTLVVSGHLHEWRDEVVHGIRVIVNAHGGDVHGLALRREDFELLHVRVEGEVLSVERRKYPRRRDLHTAWDQFAVRLWSDRRRPWGALLGWPAAIVLRLLGRYVPVVRHPVERRLPDRATLEARRRIPLEPQ